VGTGTWRGRLVAHQQIEHRQVVAQRLAAGGGVTMTTCLPAGSGGRRRPGASTGARCRVSPGRRATWVHHAGCRRRCPPRRADGGWPHGGIRFQMLGAEIGTTASSDSWGISTVPGKIGENQGIVHCTLSPFLCYLTTKSAPGNKREREPDRGTRQAGRPVPPTETRAARDELVPLQGGGDLKT